jgi:hypothetical protein
MSNLIKVALLSSLFLLVAVGCGGGPPPPRPNDGGGSGSSPSYPTELTETSGAATLKGEVWADNWFALYLGDKLLIEDSVSINTERSFNAEVFTFKADYPLVLNFIIKDFKENDTGLEYIGAGNQQMGDGGFIAQFTDETSGKVVAVSNDSWKCLVIHEAPLDKACENESNPVAGEGLCGFTALDAPTGWKNADFDNSSWVNATAHSASAVGPKDGYDEISWDSAAQIIWTSDLETHNTILCRTTVEGP